MTDTDTLTRVNIIRLAPVQTGVRGDKPWTKYQVEAATPDGRPLPLDKPVYTFDSLDVGHQDVLILPYVQRSTGNVVSYTMKRPQPKTKKSGGGAPADDERLTKLTREMERLTARVKALEDLYESIPTGATRP